MRWVLPLLAVLLAGCQTLPPLPSSAPFTPTAWQFKDAPPPAAPAPPPEPRFAAVQLAPPTRSLLGPVPTRPTPLPPVLAPPPAPKSEPTPGPWDARPVKPTPFW